jgi:hypothetical protein
MMNTNGHDETLYQSSTMDADTIRRKFQEVHEIARCKLYFSALAAELLEDLLNLSEEPDTSPSRPETHDSPASFVVLKLPPFTQE